MADSYHSPANDTTVAPQYTVLDVNERCKTGYTNARGEYSQAYYINGLLDLLSRSDQSSEVYKDTLKELNRSGFTI